jgi:hypothetical protein
LLTRSIAASGDTLVLTSEWISTPWLRPDYSLFATLPDWSNISCREGRSLAVSELAVLFGLLLAGNRCSIAALCRIDLARDD